MNKPVTFFATGNFYAGMGFLTATFYAFDAARLYWRLSSIAP